MRKLYAGILTIICALSLGIFSACNSDVKISVKQEYIEAFIGDTFDLNSYFETDKDVSLTYSSFDRNVAEVSTGGQVVAVGEGVTFVQASFENTKATIELKVKGEPKSATVPANVNFDKENESLIWNAQYITIDGQTSVVNSYTILAESQGVTREFVVTNKTSFSDFLVGTYTYKVKANGLSNSGITVYNSSEYSQPITVTKHPSAINLKYSKQSKILSWEYSREDAQFRVIVNGIASEPITSKQFNLSLLDESATQNTQYNISVMATSEGENVCPSYSESLSITRLVAPQISINNGVVTWESGITEGYHYELEISDSMQEPKIVEVSGGKYNFDSAEIGKTYNLTMRAVSDSDNILSSENVSKITGVKKLETVELEYDPNTKTFMVADYANKEIELEITGPIVLNYPVKFASGEYKVSDEVLELLKLQIKNIEEYRKIKYNSLVNAFKFSVEMENGKHEFSFTNAGTFTVKVKNISKINTEIDSEYSNEIIVINLATVNTGLAKHYIDADGNYILNFNNVSHANTYDIYIDDVLQTYQNNTLGLASELFTQSGEYTLKIKASSSLSGVDGIYMTPSVASFKVQRLSDVEITTESDLNPQSITWNAVDDAKYYQVNVYKNGQLDQTLSKSEYLETSYDTSKFGYGSYKFEIIACAGQGKSIATINTLILDSLNCAQKEFKVTQTLDAVTFSFDLETKTLLINKVDFANNYDIKLNSQQLPVTSQTETQITIDLKNTLESGESGDYVIEVVSQNTNEELLLDSSVATYTITKLVAPNKATLSEDANVDIVDEIDESILDAQKTTMLINDVLTTTIDGEQTEFNVKVKYNATKQQSENCSYIDSDYAEFNIKRVDAPVIEKLEDNKLYWNYLENELFENRILFIQGENEFETENNLTSPYDISNIEQIDYTKDFSVKVRYFAKAQTFNISNGDVYYTSNYSEAFDVHKFSDQIMFEVVETTEGVLITWDKSEIDGVNYLLYLDETLLIQTQENEYIATSFGAEKVYNLYLVIEKNGYLTSNKVNLTIERLALDINVNINLDESIEATTAFGQEKDSVAVEKILLTVNGVEVDSLQTFDNSFTLTAQVIAKQKEKGNIFFLSSNQGQYNFNRLSVNSAPTTGSVVEYAEVENTDCYVVKFAVDDDNFVELTSYSSSLDLTTTDAQQKLFALGASRLLVSVKAHKNAYEASNAQINYLSSRYSTTSTLVLFDAPTNLTASTNLSDYLQRPIKLSWTHENNNGYVHGFKFTIYYNGEEIDYMLGDEKIDNNYIINNATLVQYATEIYSPLFNKAGVYEIKLVALSGEGSLHKVDSSATVSFEILQTPSEISIDENAIVSWNKIQNAQSYVVKYYYSDNVQAVKQNVTDNKLDLSELFEIDFYGDFTIEILAVGQGEQTFSSVFSQKLNVTKQNKATLTFDVNSLTIGGQFEEGTTFDVSVLYGEEVVKQLTMSLNETYTFEDWTLASGEKIDSSVEQVFTFRVITLPDKQNSIKSSSEIKSVTRLASISNYGFRKVDGVIQFACDEVAHSSKLIMYFDGFESDAFALTDGKQVLLMEQYLKDLSLEFSLKVIARGEVNQTGITYINSVSTTITGQKLPEVEGISVQDGLFVWNKVDKATDYNILVGEDVLSGYVIGPKHFTSIDLKGYTGSLTVNVKAIGNLTTELKTTNVILDSLYNHTDGQRNDLSVYKLAKVTNVCVSDGNIAFTTTEKAESYEIVVNGKNYPLSTYKNLENITQFYCTSMYKDLSANQNYYAKIIAKSAQENVIYSDLSNEIIINILSNDSRGSVRIEKKIKSYDPIVYDYTTTNLVWNSSSNEVNGYIVNIGGSEYKTATPLLVLTEIEHLLPGTLYSAKVCVAGTSEKDSNGAYHLSSHYSEEVVFQKLDTPQVKVEEGLLAWELVEGATGYMVFLEDSQVNTTVIATTSYFLDLANLQSNRKYTTYEVMAVSSANFCLASEKGLYVDNSSKAKEVIKLQAPDMLEINNGSFGYSVDDSDLMNFALSSLTRPFTTSKDTIQSDELILRFTGKSNTNHEFTMPAAMFIKLTESQVSLINTFVGSSNPQLVKYLTKGGWPTNLITIDEYAENLPAGEYTLSVAQKGDDEKYLTSNFGGDKTVYVPYAPQIRIEFENDSFMLKWNAIDVPSTFMSASDVTYVVAVVEPNESEDPTDPKTVINVVEETKLTNLNLTELINNGTITEKTEQILVYVKGNSDSVINGKISNKIDVEVLEGTKAFVHNGELGWTPQEKAMGYYVYYYPLEDSSLEQKVFVKEPNWNCAELSSEHEYYTIHIQAVGAEVDSWTEIMLSGAKSNVGKISKLSAPVLSVEDSVLAWTNITNATSYFGKVIDVNGDVVANPYVKVADPIVVGGATQEGTCYYETSYKLAHAVYSFQAIGSKDIILDENMSAYVNSDFSNSLVGTTIDSVENIRMEDGIITWDTVYFKNAYITRYKLTFTKINDEGTSINETITVFVDGVNQGETCKYNCSELLQEGRYTVAIQAYYETNNALGKYTYNNQTAYYLISLKDASTEFRKLGVVENIRIEGSVIKWDYTQTDIDARFKLIFTDKVTKDEIIIYADENQYSSYIVEQLIVANAFNLEIKTTPALDVESVVDSSKVVYQDENGVVDVVQLNSVQDEQIVILTDLIDSRLSWKNYSTGIENLEVKYLLTYWINQEQPKQKLLDETQIFISELNFSIDSNDAISYTIQVIPQNGNYVRSCPSNVHEIKKPDPVSDIVFDSTSQIFSWSSYSASKDHVFRIVDYVLETDLAGEIVYNEDGSYKVAQKYEYTTLDSQTLTYAPAKQGVHIVSIAVIVKNSASEGGLISNFRYYFEQDGDREIGTPITINLFDGLGDGTVENPYWIANEQQFTNLSYRLNKLEYLNSYKLTQNDETTQITLTDANAQYNFLQTANISTTQTLQDVSFYGNYDGNYFELKLVSNIQGKEQVALFGKIEASATFKNIHLLVDYGKNAPTKNLSINNFAIINNGAISNVKIGNEGETLSITSDYNLVVSMLVGTNNGTIESVVNYYNINLVNSTTVSGNSISFGGVAVSNKAKIKNSANYGTMNFTTTIVTAGGISASNTSSGEIDGCVYDSSKMAVLISKSSTYSQTYDVSVYVGGIVGINQQGKISHSYAHTEMNVVKSGVQTSTNSIIAVGGLVGRSVNSRISYSYVNVTRTAGSITDYVNQIIGVLNASTAGTGKTVYYKEQTSFLSGGDDSFTPSTYEIYPTELNADGLEYFDIRVSSMPKLIWEDIYLQAWKTNQR